MYLPLIFLLLSFAGIVIMIRRELVLVRNGQVLKAQHSHPFVPDLQKIKHFTFKNGKKFGYRTVFETLRFFIKSSNFVKTEGKALIKELENKFKSKNGSAGETAEKKEVSKYLRVISEYRQKIREMKHKIKEEEGIE